MCGIFGVFSSIKAGFTNKQMEVLGQNIIINQFRGTDSTGLFCVDHQGKSELIKVLGGAGSLFANDAWDPFQASISKKGKIVVGHGRAATRGTVKLENAHPFAKTFPTGEVLKLVHNGTLDFDQDLPDFKKFDVDSEWIAEMIVRYGPKEALTQIRGAMALVWWNEKEQTINFFRNAERPLHFGRFKGQYEDTFVLNSEAAAVRYLSERNGLTPFKKDVPVFYFAPHTHYVLPLENLFGDFLVAEEFDKPKARKVVSYTGYNYQRPGGYGYGNVWDDEDLEPWSGERSYVKDLQALIDGHYKYVEFIPLMTKEKDWHRVTQNSRFSTMREAVDAPYLPGLRKMERIMRDVGNTGNKPWVRMTYYDKEANKSWESFVGVPDPTTPVTKQHEAPADPQLVLGDYKDPNYYKAFADVGCQKFSPGRKFRWTSRSGTTVVRHEATVSDEGGHVLKRYKNDQDGVFIVGQKYSMEITDLQEVEFEGKKYYRADGQRVSSRTDRCVDVCAYFPEDSLDGQLLYNCPSPADMPFVFGEVERVELATKDWNEDSGAFVILILKDMQLLAEDSDGSPGCNVLTGEFTKC